MFKHTVMWRLKAEAAARPAGENGKELKARLENLRSVLPEIRHLEVGLNRLDSEAAADVVLHTAFDDAEAFHRYRDHPVHRELVAWISEIVSERRVVDYEA